MAKKKGGQDPKQETAKDASFVAVILNALTGKETETTGEATKTFLDFWQRKRGESMASAQNILKAIGVVAGYTTYRHIDPVPGSRADNLGMFGAAAVLLALLVIPRSNEMGGRFKEFESIALKGIQNLALEEKQKLLQWVRELSNWQEKRLVNLLKSKDTEGKETFDISMLKEADMRQLLLELIGEEPKLAEDVEKTVAAVRDFFKRNWPATKETLEAADAAVAGHLHGLRSFLHSKGIRQNRQRHQSATLGEKIQRFFNLIERKG